MSGLASCLEDEGIATTLIALVRPHAERMRPPRALWVPFELGRPLGPPGEPAFQRRVAAAALGLLVREDGPVILEDFAEDDPSGAADPAWDFPARIGGDSRAEELASVRPFYETARAVRGRTTVGLSGVPFEQGVAWLAAVDDPEPPERPRRDMAAVHLIRLVGEDLKAFYSEAATGDPPRPSGTQVKTWFWTRTRAGRLLRDLRRRSLRSESKPRQQIANLLVPVDYRD